VALYVQHCQPEGRDEKIAEIMMEELHNVGWELMTTRAKARVANVNGPSSANTTHSR
jgi:hypothetical protein